jgi:hypothetical protein
MVDRYGNSGFSTKNLVDFVFEVSGGEQGYLELQDLYMNGMTVNLDPILSNYLLKDVRHRMKPLEAQRKLLEMAEGGNAMAQYMVGK